MPSGSCISPCRMPQDCPEGINWRIEVNWDYIQEPCVIYLHAQGTSQGSWELDRYLQNPERINRLVYWHEFAFAFPSLRGQNVNFNSELIGLNSGNSYLSNSITVFVPKYYQYPRVTIFGSFEVDGKQYMPPPAELNRGRYYPLKGYLNYYPPPQSLTYEATPVTIRMIAWDVVTQRELVNFASTNMNLTLQGTEPTFYKYTLGFVMPQNSIRFWIEAWLNLGYDWLMLDSEGGDFGAWTITATSPQRRQPEPL